MQPPSQAQQPHKVKHNAEVVFGVFLGIALYIVCFWFFNRNATYHVYGVLWSGPTNSKQSIPMWMFNVVFVAQIVSPALGGTLLSVVSRRIVPYISRGILIGSVASIVLYFILINSLSF